jgi:hypothetical protein
VDDQEFERERGFKYLELILTEDDDNYEDERENCNSKPKK